MNAVAVLENGSIMIPAPPDLVKAMEDMAEAMRYLHEIAICIPEQMDWLGAVGATARAKEALHKSADKLGLPLHTIAALVKQAAAEGLMPQASSLTPQASTIPYPQVRGRPRASISPEDIVRALEDARSMKEVALRLGTSCGTARKYVRLAVEDGHVSKDSVPDVRKARRGGGRKSKKRCRRLDRARHRPVPISPQMIAPALEGAKSIREVADRLALPYVRVRVALAKALRDGHIPAEVVPDGRRVKDETKATACRLRGEGWTLASIGKAIGVSRQRVHTMLQEAERF
ncbi:hypothetical protein [Azospirillum sp. TSO5]|uniref:hypothetical protein n=1 Tax=Azospirillum sp. TSO5 TaxID=716760 RepID=UPI000D6107F7|nr:hypothetical protein [Azospirillum sp. TSO5]PWC92943.1 hypothetical protein TSO5_16070 [Azospirillum sp. TSO5]